MKFNLSVILSLIFLFVGKRAFGQGPEVPVHLQFADISLHIKEGARKQIQADVDALWRNKTYFDRKLATVDLYFPIIERVLREENVPDDFKYLAIQESALVPDAVSSSNAVGFWQFKAPTAEEVGLRVDRNVDERMNIVSATQGAARYLKKNNFYNDNWLISLLAYMTGQGGVEAHFSAKFRGAKRMEIDTRTHWYVKKFLAYKIAFENEIGKNKNAAYHLQEYTRGADKTIGDIADEFSVDAGLVNDYNKWLKHGRIPSDKTYTVLVPIAQNNLVAQEKAAEIEEKPSADNNDRRVARTTQRISASKYDFDKVGAFPVIENKSSGRLMEINGLPGTVAEQGQSPNSLAAEGGISLKHFLKYNDLTTNERIIPGEVYYFKRKRSKAKVRYHIARPGQTLWEISQIFGVRLDKLMMRNRMEKETDLDAGRILWMRFIRPASVPVEYKKYDQNPVPPASPPVVAKVPVQDIVREAPKRETPKNQAETFDFDEGAIDMANVAQDKNSPPEKNPGGEMPLKSRTQPLENSVPENPDPPKSNRPEAENAEKSRDLVVHNVAKGESLFSIAQQYGVTIQEIADWNNLDLNAPLSIGQELRLFPNMREKATSSNLYNDTPDAGANGYFIHNVGPSETLYSIARKYNVSIKDLMELNHKEDFNLKINEALKVPKD